MNTAALPWIRLITVQFCSLGLCVAWLTTPIGPKLSLQEVQLLGQTLTLILIASGLWAYMNAPNRPVPWLALVLMALPAPVYAFLGGGLRSVLIYAALGLAAQAIAIWRQVHNRTDSSDAA